MKPTIGVALLFCLFACQSLRAELILAVDFDLNEAGIQSNAIVNEGKTTAWVVLFLTADTNIYSYKFSVRYNTNLLSSPVVDDTPPTVNGKQFLEELNDQTVSSGSGNGFNNYDEIHRFDGKLDVDTLFASDVPTSGVVLAKLSFNVTGSGNELLIMPGLFEQIPASIDFNRSDTFLNDDGPVPVNLYLGGNLVAVPEPSSLLLLTFVAVALLASKPIRRKFLRQ